MRPSDQVAARPPRPAGTRKTPRPVREEQMLDVAGRAFARRGYHNVSMEEVAELAGVSKPMLYAYFESKEGLYLAYLHRSGEDLLARLRDVPRDEPDPERRLSAGIDAFWGFVDEQRDGWRVLYQEAAAQGGAVAAEVALLRVRLIEGVADLLRACADDRGASYGRELAVDALAHAVVGAGESLANWWVTHPDVPRATVVGWLMRAISNAVGPAAATTS